MIEKRDFPRPIVLVSKCLEFENVRYNGQLVRSQIIRDLMPLVDFLKVCPECDIGMGVPRDPIRIVKKGHEYRLIQPATGEDLTDRMDAFTDQFLASMDDVDGFIFKSGSPTIGIRNIKVYAGNEMAPVVEKGAGFFAKKILAKYSGFPMEEDDRLRNYRIRHHFLTQLYTFADFRHVKASGSMEEIVEFNKKNMFLFSFYDSATYGKMCELLANILANDTNGGYEQFIEAVDSYEKLLKSLMKKPGDADSRINTARSILSCFEESMSSHEKDYYEDLFVNYRENRVDEDALTEVLRLSVVLYGGTDMNNNTILYPYPEILRMPCGEKRDKDYWVD
ncbi:DUF523 and DUF1722 domain-containing protein [Methanolobus sp.]|uniref:YbgA family protein n=1 Tax=Methanolobus sp. TaxID=1874737 RepID=UPI0025DF9958|nr:DUF523 and DUF1722 domain-containing protein [Methanolobus sp.]